MASKETSRGSVKRKAASIKPKIPSKRQRNDTTIQWINPVLNLVQNVVGHPPMSALTQYAHSTMLQLPLQPGILTRENIHQHFKSSSWKTTFPVPLIVHTNHMIGLGEFFDPMLRLVKAKKIHSATLQRVKSFYTRKKSAIRKVCKEMEGKLYSTMVFKVAEQMERDPDRWFSDELGYDFYFTGGNMSTVDVGETRYIINTVGERMNIVEIIPFGADKGHLNVETSRLKRYEVSEELGPVFEVCWSETEHGFEDESSLNEVTNSNMFADACFSVALRMKNQIDILLIKSETNIIKSRNISSDVPFISCCFSQRISDTVLYTSDMDKKIKIWNYVNGQEICVFDLPKADTVDDCWSCIRTIKKNHIVCLDRVAIRLFKSSNDLVLEQETPLSMWLWKCERASCMEVCFDNKLIFIGTTHKLLVIQLIDSQEVGSPEFQQIITFTHNLKHFPTMVKFVTDSEQSYHVWISSQIPGDTIICNFAKVPPKRFATDNLPQKPLTVHESYHLARTNGKCIYPSSVLKQRLQLFHSGLALLVDSADIHLLLQTSFGDIFHQMIIDASHTNNSKEIPEIYHSLMMNLNKIKDEQLRPLATDFKNFRGLKKILICENLDTPRIPEHPDNPFRRRPRWKQTVEQLHQYKDLLAPSMLSIWGFRPDVTRERPQQEQRRLSTEEPMDIKDRVFDWLNTTEAVGSPEEQVEQPANDEPIDANDEDNDAQVLQARMQIVDVSPGEDPTFVGPASSRGVTRDDKRVVKNVAKSSRRTYVKGF